MIHFFSNWYVLLPMAFTMFVATRLTLTNYDAQLRSLLGASTRACCVMLMWFSFLAIGLRGWVGIPWIALVAVVAVVLFRKRRRLERNAMYLSAYRLRSQEDQTQLLACFQREQVGQLPRIASRLAKCLGGGASWPDVLERGRVAHGAYEVLAIRLFHRYGDAAADKTQGAELVSPIQIEEHSERLLARFAIFGWVLFVAPIVALIMTVIFPTFVKMFDEFGISLPPAMTFLGQLFDGQSSIWVSISLLVFGAGLILVLLTAGVLWMFPQLLRTLPFRWLGRDYFRGVGFCALGQVAVHETELTRLFQATSEMIPVSTVAQQYRVAAQRIAEGVLPSDALVASGIISRRERSMFSGLDGADPLWGLRQYAAWRVERMLNRYSLVVQFCVVFVTLALAALVGIFAYAFIGTLAELINSQTI